MIGGTAVFENVSEYLDEAVRLADRCPEKYQVPCFEALIRILASPDSLHRQIGNGYVPPLDSFAETSSPITKGSHEPAPSIAPACQVGVLQRYHTAVPPCDSPI